MNSDDEVIPVLRAVDVIRKNPEAYWGKKNPLPEDISLAMLDQIEVETGVRGSADNFGSWNIVASNESWLKSLVNSDEDVYNLFSDVHSFDDGRNNSLRTEYFLGTVSDSVAVWFDRRFISIKGDVDESLQACMREKFLDQTCICYTTNWK